MLRVGRTGSLQVFSFAYLTLTLPCWSYAGLIDSYGRVRGLQQKPGYVIASKACFELYTQISRLVEKLEQIWLQIWKASEKANIL